MSSIALLCLAQSFQLPCCNLFTPHAMFVYLKENTSSELWTPVQSLPLIHLSLLLFTFLQTTITFHTIQLTLCFQQTGEIDNLTVRWGKVLSLCCAGFQVASNTFESFASSYWFDNLGFLLRENLLLYSSYLPLGVSQ